MRMFEKVGQCPAIERAAAMERQVQNLLSSLPTCSHGNPTVQLQDQSKVRDLSYD